MATNKQNLARMKQDIELRGMAANTLDCYLRYVRIFLEHAERPVEELDETDVRDFLVYLFQKRGTSPGTANAYSAAIRFFFAVTLNRTMNYLQIPRFKQRKTLPEILTREEIHVLFENCTNLKHKAILMLAYGSGLRSSEIASLKVRDIDSKEMRVFVRSGKGGKDRYTLLSHKCLCVLREYWTVYRPRNPEGWLFLGVRGYTHIIPDSVGVAFKTWLSRTGIKKDVSVHSLRHAFASHLLEDGVGLFQIKELLGHASLSSTTVYLHLANLSGGINSPADTVAPIG